MGQLSQKIFKGAAHYVTSPMGWRRNPATGVTSYHNGYDYGTSRQKLNQYAVESGVVLQAGSSKSAGKYVWVKYPRLNKKMFHCHLDQINVTAGQAVDHTTILGVTGTTGNSTGIHLHLTVVDLTTGQYVNPETYVIPAMPVATKPAASVGGSLKRGDRVKIIGYGNGSSNGNSARSGAIGSVRTIIQVWSGRKFPYQVGKDGVTTGFYTAGALKKV
jgi:hypothetical protein